MQACTASTIGLGRQFQYGETLVSSLDPQCIFFRTCWHQHQERERERKGVAVQTLHAIRLRGGVPEK
jgi:hypothetical protein